MEGVRVALLNHLICCVAVCFSRLSKVQCLLLKTAVRMQDEAFSLWETEWASLYDAGSTGHQIIQNIMDCWYLVSVVENDYINGDVFRVFNAA